MTMDTGDWRAIALGYCSMLAWLFVFGLSWWVPAVGVAVTIIVRSTWR